MLFRKRPEKWLPITISLLFVLFLSFALYFNPPPLQNFLKRFENIAYDAMLWFEYQPVSQESPIVVVDVDDRSIITEGRWPWNRKKLGKLISNLYASGAKAVAFDIIFPESEANLVDQVVQEIQAYEGKPINIPELESSKQVFNYDDQFAKALAQGNSVLGFAFTHEGQTIGELPAPLLELPPGSKIGTMIPDMSTYLANIPILQKSAKAGGFINATPDSDGILRFSPMILRHKEKVFSSLSLAAVNLFLNKPELKILVGEYQGVTAIEGIQLGKTVIPTDQWGRILVPFRGPPFSVKYVSATDILSGKAGKEAVWNKLVFIGSSATAMGDLVASAIAPIFAGIEVHAHIASGILEGYLPSRPAWEKGVRVFIILVVGAILSFTLPFIGPITSFFVTAIFASLLLLAYHYMWQVHQIVFPIVFPLLSVFILFVINEISGYLFESRRRKDLKAIFGQYVPPDYLDQMLKKRGEFGLEGESKELTVLFSDIRQFTKLCEKLPASDLKMLLNHYLTPMTEVIFHDKGTIDKYVGDMIMAFWGAPLDDPSHAEHAINASFDMHRKLKDLNQDLASLQMPPIQIGVGINTGSMNVGDMGSKYRKAYTVLGDAVNLGSRLESLTRVYNVDTVVGETTYEKTKSLFTFRLLDKVIVKGKAQAILIYEPLCKKGEETAEMREKLELHQKGLEAYMQKRWDEAEAIFMKLKEKLYDVYLSRIAAYRLTPPPEGWDGTTILESK
ncbi:MAG: adenylate/guanylate cyclase domain-containing protein [Parachlamydiales bacterium]|nr:adenylate/guanylate cyclase domain-containing protein [Parachlamydiales bacterium]